MGFIDGPNPYVYVGNNPLNYVDPWGLCLKSTRENVKSWLIENFSLPEAYADEIGNSKRSHIKTFGWPYSWKGWGGLILTGTGGAALVLPVPGARPVGLWMIKIGIGLTLWDAAEGIVQSIKSAEEVGEAWLERDREEWKEIDQYLN